MTPAKVDKPTKSQVKDIVEQKVVADDNEPRPKEPSQLIVKKTESNISEAYLEGSLVMGGIELVGAGASIASAGGTLIVESVVGAGASSVAATTAGVVTGGGIIILGGIAILMGVDLIEGNGPDKAKKVYNWIMGK